MMTQTYNLTETDLFLDQDQQYILRFRDMAVEDRPREKLIKFGPEILSAAELLALVFNVGNKKEDVLALSRRLLREYGEKTIVDQTDVTRVSKELNIPIIKACQVVACFELGRRFFQNSPDRVEYLRTARQVYNYLKDMAKLPKEHLRGLYLNSQYKLIHDEVISIGSLTANIVHPREVFKPALAHSASALILAHNHPSGDVRPSEADMEITKQIVAAGKILGIELLDHVIVTKNKFASIKIGHD